MSEDSFERARRAFFGTGTAAESSAPASQFPSAQDEQAAERELQARSPEVQREAA